MTDEQLAEIVARWDIYAAYLDANHSFAEEAGYNWFEINACPIPDDSAGFLLHAHEDVPALIAEVRRLRALEEERRQDWLARDGNWR